MSTSSRGQQGQASTELALSLPVVIAMLLLIIQVGVLTATQVAVVNAARDAARISSRGGSEIETKAAAMANGLRRDRLTVQIGIDEPPGSVTARVTYRARVVIPLVNRVRPDIKVSATTVMVKEPT